MKLRYKIAYAAVAFFAFINIIIITSDSSNLLMNDLIVRAYASNENNTPQTKWIRRQVRYDCIYYVLGKANGCTNCAWDCEGKKVPIDDPTTSNCHDPRTCCQAVPGWSAIFGPCTYETN